MKSPMLSRFQGNATQPAARNQSNYSLQPLRSPTGSNLPLRTQPTIQGKPQVLPSTGMQPVRPMSGSTSTFAGNQSLGNTQYMQGTQAAPGIMPIGMVEGYNPMLEKGLQGLYEPRQMGFEKGAIDTYQQALKERQSATPYFNQGNQAYGQAQEMTGLSAQSYLPQVNQVRQQFENPYLESVMQPTLRGLNERFQGGLNDINQRSQGMGAFGGTRQAVLQGQAQKDYNTQATDYENQMRSQGFEQAQNAALQELNNQRQAQQTAAGLYGNQATTQYGLGQNAIDTASSLANQGINIRGQNQQDYGNWANNLIAGGTLARNINQQQLDAAKAQREGLRNYQIGNLDMLNKAAGSLGGGGSGGAGGAAQGGLGQTLNTIYQGAKLGNALAGNPIGSALTDFSRGGVSPTFVGPIKQNTLQTVAGNLGKFF